MFRSRTVAVPREPPSGVLHAFGRSPDVEPGSELETGLAARALRFEPTTLEERTLQQKESSIHTSIVELWKTNAYKPNFPTCAPDNVRSLL